MKICVTSTGSTLDAGVDPRFGRCSHFVFVDSETLELEAVSNPHADASGGAGIQSAQFVVNRGAGAVVTGRVGPNAEGVLSSARVEIVCVTEGSAREAVDVFEQRHAGSGTPGLLEERPVGVSSGRGRGRRIGRRRGLGSRRRL